MAQFNLNAQESLYYEYVPAREGGKTAVFVNALTGDAGMWQGTAAPALHEKGHGTLCYNFRGQAQSTCPTETELDPDGIVSDLNALMDHLGIEGAVLVGLSIGGLFAAQAHLASPRSSGLVLINTLRKPTKRLEWINKAMIELAQLGGGRLLMTANAPQIVNPDFLPNMWGDIFAGPYEPMAPSDGLFRLMKGSLKTDWDFPYEELRVPVLLMTGLHDRVFRIEADVAELTTRIPETQSMIYSDAGHMIPLERPDRFAADLVEFVGNL